MLAEIDVPTLQGWIRYYSDEQPTLTPEAERELFETIRDTVAASRKQK